jgi:hypothetical protein
MRVSVSVYLLSVVSLLLSNTDAFVVTTQRFFPAVKNNALSSTTESSTEALQDSVNSKTTKTTLGLLTFDLDDTLYPLAPVIEEANKAFSRAMEKYGFPGIQPEDINSRSIQIRQEMAETDPEGAAVLTHTEIRKLAIRREMESVMLRRKLEDCAADWATNVESLGPAVVQSAKKCVRVLVAMLMLLGDERLVFSLDLFISHVSFSVLSLDDLFILSS